MKYSLRYLCLFLSVMTYAQLDVSVSSLSGYEFNINKLPSSFLQDDEVLGSEDLYQNSFFQDVKAQLKYSYEHRRSVFKINFTPQKRFYLSESESNRLLADLKVNYTYKFSKKTKWENAMQYFMKDQNGLDADENEIGASFGYDLLNVNSKLHFRLHKSNRSFIGLHYGKKDFDPSATRTVSYQKYGINGGFKNVKWKNHLLRSYGLTASVVQRKYNIAITSDEDVSSTENRTWYYLTVKGFYKMDLDKYWTLYPSLNYEKRIDQSDEQFSYNEISPKIYLSYTKRKVKGSVSTSYVRRDFTELEVNEEDLLTYDYFRFKASLDYKLSDKLSLLATAYTLNRKSNNADISTQSFRSYSNHYAGIGLRWNF